MTAAFFTALIVTFFLAWILVPIALKIAELFCLFALIGEREAKVFILFGRVIGVLDEPGLHFLTFRLGPQALLIRFFGEVRTVDLRLDQQYLRSQPVNSEEGTPMGVGVWCEMSVCDPVAYLFRNSDPRGSLWANVSNATVRGLSNMPLDRLLEDRHAMSRLVRQEVTEKSEAWGYRLGSVYIRKVHFRDAEMIHQIEQKVMNRLRQVTSAIRQMGANQVAVIRSSAEKTAATEFARAQAVRPQLVGACINELSRDREVLGAVFEILETAKILSGHAELTLLPSDNADNTRSSILTGILATSPSPSMPPALPATTDDMREMRQSREPGES